MKGLLTRASTAIIFVGVMLGGLYGGRESFVILFAVITALCLWEFLGLTLEGKKQRRDRIRKFLGMVLGLTPFFVIAALMLDLVTSVEGFILFSSLVLFPLIFLTFIYELFTGSDQPFVNIAFILLGMIYIGIPFAMLEFIAFDGELFHANIVFGLLLLTWTNDTSAYLVGSQIGKTPLYSRISPKKTWEGSLGGVVITFGVAFILSRFFQELTIQEWMVLGAIVAIFGSIGDLVESMLKRSMEIKDSGTLLPGHGGLLDRFDGFIFLIPYATAYLLWIR